MVTFDKNFKALNVPSGLGTPSGNESGTTTDVQWNQIVTGGTKIAEITIDDETTEVYAPESGQGGVTPEEVQQAIDSALTPYSTTQEVEGMLQDYATTATTSQLRSQVSSNTDAIENIGQAQAWDRNAINTLTGTTIPAMQGEINTLTGQTSNLQGQVNTLTGQTASIQGQVNTLTGRTEEVANSASTVYDEVFYENESGETQSRISDNEDAIVDLQDRMSQAESDIADKSTVSAHSEYSGGTFIGSVKIDGVKTEFYVPNGGGGSSDYVVVSDLSDVAEPVEGMMATVEGHDDEFDVEYADFSNYQDYDGSTFVTLYRTSDDGWMKDIRFEDGQFRDDIYNDELWHEYEWEGQVVKLRAFVDSNDPSQSYIEIVAHAGAYLTAGSYSTVSSDVDSEYIPAKTYVNTNGGWHQYGKVYKYSEIKDNTEAEAQALVDEIRLLAKTGIPIWFDFESKDGIEGLIPYVGDSGTWVNFVGAGFQYGSGRYTHLYLSNTIFDDNGFDSHGIRIDNNDIVNLPSTQCLYVGPNGDIWSHRSPGNAFEEQNQPYMAVKGCLEDFSEEYGFGSILYTMKNYDSGQDLWTYTICMLVPTPSGVMKGVWTSHDMYDGSQYTLTSWTAY